MNCISRISSLKVTLKRTNQKHGMARHEKLNRDVLQRVPTTRSFAFYYNVQKTGITNKIKAYRNDSKIILMNF